MDAATNQVCAMDPAFVGEPEDLNREGRGRLVVLVVDFLWTNMNLRLR